MCCAALEPECDQAADPGIRINLVREGLRFDEVRSITRGGCSRVTWRDIVTSSIYLYRLLAKLVRLIILHHASNSKRMFVGHHRNQIAKLSSANPQYYSNDEQESNAILRRQHQR